MAQHGVDHAAELDENSVAGALDDTPVMSGDGGIDQIAAQPPEARQGTIFGGAGEPAIADDVGDPDRRELPGSRSLRPSSGRHFSTEASPTSRTSLSY